MWTLQQVLDHEAKLARTKGKSAPADACERETGRDGLHARIMEWCDAQWPRVKYIHSRTDQRPTVAVGSHDFTIFLPGGITICLECKAKGKKVTPEQQAWMLEMGLIGHKVWVVYSYEEFMEIVKEEGK